jgi:hypothetical protein
MKKLLVAALSFSFAAFAAGCTPEFDRSDNEADEDPGVSPESITSFFGSGDSTSPLCVNGVPIANNPKYNNGAVYVDAQASCIMVGATMKLLVPFSTTTYGPYPLSFDETGTRLRTPSLGPSIVPSPSCRLVQITNPNGQVSNTPSFCR